MSSDSDKKKKNKNKNGIPLRSKKKNVIRRTTQTTKIKNIWKDFGLCNRLRRALSSSGTNAAVELMPAELILS